MKKELREMIRKLELELARQNGEWAISIPTKNNPSQKEIALIRRNKQELIAELRKMQKEEIARNKEEKLNQDIKTTYYDGEILQGYSVTQNADLMIELGLAKMVSGWGHLVKKEVIEALGEEFTADEARAYAESLKEEKPEEKTEGTEDEKINKALEVAKSENKKVEFARYTVPCDGSAYECDTDILVKYVDADGEVTQQRIHTH